MTDGWWHLMASLGLDDKSKRRWSDKKLEHGNMNHTIAGYLFYCNSSHGNQHLDLSLIKESVYYVKWTIIF